MSGVVLFYPGIHQPSDAHRFDLACVSINRLRGRMKPIQRVRVIIDSGAFTELNIHGCYRHPVEVYASELHRLHVAGIVQIDIAVAQDFMCESFMLAKTGMSLDEHQRLTIKRYDGLSAEMDRLFQGSPAFPIMPVLQGFSPASYARHVRDYGDRLLPGMWVGVGSVCKRQGDPRAIVAVLQAIHAERPDLRLHGFGVKRTSLLHPGVREMLYSADSMAWSFAARKQGRDANDWREAVAFTEIVNAAALAPASAWQMEMF